MAIEGKFQIGEVADAVGLSIRTIRHYDELGVVEPSGRSAGGFRLYTDADVERLNLVKRIKPLRFSLEEIQELLEIFDDPSAHDDDRVTWFVETAEARCQALRGQLSAAEQTVDELRKVNASRL